MILIDTSAWVEFLRDTGSRACIRVEALLGGEFAVCDPVRMEVLAGARDETHLGRLRRLMATAQVIPTGPAHYDEGAALYRLCRLGGETPRRMFDCLIAAVAVSAGAVVLHADTDFDVLARHTALRLA
ncbi:MAG TPA: PIN domain nuclease [Acidimicrobiales bacterium]|nr:PIN domain nuclease [Acidimicrobiales bacterium]